MEQKMHPLAWIIIWLLGGLIIFKLIDTDKEVVVVYEPVYTGEAVVYTGEELVSTDVEVTGSIVEEEIIEEEVETCILTGANVTAKFTQRFIDHYEYEHNENYKFALKVNGLYYDVSRNERGWVDNAKGLLNWAAPANQLVEWYTRYIPFGVEVYVAQPNWIYGYKKAIFTGVDTYELSPVKEWVVTSDLTVENVFDCQ